MHFYTTLSLYLLSTSASASASALPSPRSTESAPNALPTSASPPPTFSLSTLFAYIPTPSTSPHLFETPQQNSWMTFLLTDGAYMTTCSASAGPNDTLASESSYYDCDAVSEYPDVLFAFLVGEGVGRLTVKKMWDSKG
ncbi:hypothetical protein J1614_007818 [Plenodomus biglobosus]|nr:hypothetical protein J1614_007818 [Plenodomus biglobosus]